MKHFFVTIFMYIVNPSLWIPYKEWRPLEVFEEEVEDVPLRSAASHRDSVEMFAVYFVFLVIGTAVLWTLLYHPEYKDLLLDPNWAWMCIGLIHLYVIISKGYLKTLAKGEVRSSSHWEKCEHVHHYNAVWSAIFTAIFFGLYWSPSGLTAIIATHLGLVILIHFFRAIAPLLVSYGKF